MQSVTLDAGEVRYRAAGPTDATAAPVVFVHGALVDGSLWSKTADVLAGAGVRSYAPTLPLGSHAVAMAPDADLTPRGVARILLAFLEALELTDVTLVGNDTGGAICQLLLDTDASRVGRVVLTNCDCFDRFPPPPFATPMRLLARAPWLLTLGAPTMRLAWVRRLLGFGPLMATRPDPVQTRAWVQPILDSREVRRDVIKLFRGVQPAELLAATNRLHAFPRPARVVWGVKDPFFRLADGRRLAAAFADGTLVEVPDAKTFVALDAPDALAREIQVVAGTSSDGSVPAGIEPDTANMRSAS